MKAKALDHYIIATLIKLTTKFIKSCIMYDLIIEYKYTQA